MNVTSIAKDNADYFEDLVPEGAFKNENLFWLGAVAGDGTACAVLGSGIYGDMAYIDWIYTDPSYRRQGAARELLKWLKTLLRRNDVKVLEISYTDENEDLEEFLENERFLCDEDGDIYSVPVKDLIFSEVLDLELDGHDSGSRVITLAELEDPEVFYDYLQRNWIPFSKEADDLGLSLILMDENGEVQGCMLISGRQDGDLEISYLMSNGLTEGTFDLFLAFRELALKMDWREANIVFTDRSGEMIKIIEAIAISDRDPYIKAGRKYGIIAL